jgi:hypothetical protein
VADDAAAGQPESPHGPARLAAALDGGSGVEQALTVDALGVHRVVAVAEHDQAGIREPPVHPAIPAGPGTAVVDHPDANARQLELQPIGEGANEDGVVVTQDRVDRSPPPERVEQVAGDDIARVEHHVDVLHVVPHVGRELGQVAAQVRVGEDEDADRADAPIMPRTMPRLAAKNLCK